MSTPIPLELPHPDPSAALYNRLQNAPREHAEAMLALYEVVQGLHDKGVLEMLRGTIGSSNQILQIMVDAAKKPESVRAMRNFIVMAKAAGSLEPEVLEGVTRAALAEISRTQSPEPLSLWQLFKKLRSKDSRRALTALTCALEATGKSMESKGGR